MMASRQAVIAAVLYLFVAYVYAAKQGSSAKHGSGGAGEGGSRGGGERDAGGAGEYVPGGGGDRSVTYDGRSLIVSGKRELLFSGSVHYPRSTPEMWPEILQKTKHGGINLIQTYVFWNLHEPEKGQFNFEGNYDIFKFIRMIGEYGMYVTLRIGPFIEAEWNHGGFPYWLREVPDIIFRNYNKPFMQHMEKYAKMIIAKMKEAKLFYPQGGPIILAQIENEYNTVQLAYRELGDKYVQWAAKMAVDLGAGVPWIMCKQKDAPDPVINSCNGRHCGDTFVGPNKPYKPSLWTENWTAQYRVFGDPPSQRAAEDIAFSVARFFSKNGTLANYYMYHGGTNFGRTSSSFVTTRYYDEAPLDEFGLQREPKWGHLRDLHHALRLCRKPLFTGFHGVEKLGKQKEARIYEKPGTRICAAFLTNNHSRESANLTFRGREYLLPPRSISILPDCKTVVYNTQRVVAQHNARNFITSELANKNIKWEMTQEPIPVMADMKTLTKSPRELYDFLKDISDYAWFITSIELSKRDLPMRKDIVPVLQVSNLGHAMLAFVNGIYIGSAHGSNVEKNFVFRKPVRFVAGTNNITLLCMTTGLPDSGAYMEHRYAGIHSVSILGLNTGTLDLTSNGWGQQVGLNGEKLQIFTESGAKKVKWVPGVKDSAVTWYKTYFDSPEGNDPVILRMTSMAKGMIWVNGNNIGRYWVSYLSPLEQPTQSEYHIPRSWIKPKQNLLVIFEENGGDPEKVEVEIVNRDTICSIITEFHPPPVKIWKRDESKIKPIVDDVRPRANLVCTKPRVMVNIDFADYGSPLGSCGVFEHGNCTAPNTKKVVEKYCIGKSSCEIPLADKGFGELSGDCNGIVKTLSVQATCGQKR